jgi:hypothetical protein
MCINLCRFIVGLLLLGALTVQADVVCDGIDDDLDTNSALSNFMSATTGSMHVVYKPTGTASGTASPDCYLGEFVLGDMSDAGDTTVGILRHGNLSGVDRVCVWQYTGSFQQVVSAYTTGAWTDLWWVHTGGNLAMYKDGALVSSTASGNTSALTRKVRMCNGAPAGSAMGEGVIGRAELYTTAVSTAEIEGLWRSRLHRMNVSVPSAVWEFSSCADGASCNGQAFADRSGNGRTLTAVGTTGQGSTYLSYPWGVE